MTVYDQNHAPTEWTPWANFLDEQGSWYACSFIKKRHYHLHEKASLLLSHKIIPPHGMHWLSGNQAIFMQWLAYVSGDNENALSIGEIISTADGKSVAHNLGAEPDRVTASNTKVKPLHEKMLTALRHLLHEGELPLNRNGAAGWIKGEHCWLVSKRTIDAIRDQLSKEGHTGLPTKNGRMYDILQEHGILSPCDNKAIWKVTISGSDWSNELTVINIPVSKIWINPESRPNEFEGAITPSDQTEKKEATEEGSPDKSQHITNKKEANTPELKSSNANIPVHQKNKQETDALDLSVFLPSPLKVSNENNAEVNDVIIHSTPNTKEDSQVSSVAKIKKPEVKKESTPTLSDATGDQLFFEWLQHGVESGKIKTNAAKARVHIVPDGVILITPGIFQDFEISTDNKYDWKEVQKLILKKKVHSRDKKGLNVIKYEVKGQNRMTKINAILFNDVKLVFGDTPPLTQNPHLDRISDLNSGN